MTALVIGQVVAVEADPRRHAVPPSVCYCS